MGRGGGARQRCGFQSFASKPLVERRVFILHGQLFGCVTRITDTRKEVGNETCVVPALILRRGSWERGAFLKVMIPK
jgi:hypothetical protein